MKIVTYEIRDAYGMILYYFPDGIDWEDDYLAIDKDGYCGSYPPNKTKQLLLALTFWRKIMDVFIYKCCKCGLESKEPLTCLCHH